MRFVPSSCLKSGMILGLDLYGYSNELMLSKGQVLNEIEIKRIIKLGYQGAYICDNISQSIDISGIISSRLKNNAVWAVKNVFQRINHVDYTQMAGAIGQIKNIAYDIVGEITLNKNATVNMMDLKVFDDYTYFHSVNVAAISIVIGVSAGLSKKELYELGLGALLHDIGKVFVPKNILDKNSKLTPEEFSLVQKHSRLGNEYLSDMWDIPTESNLVVLTHHEKYDGSGYPYGLIEDKIHSYAKIVSIADVFDALTSDRPYRKAMSPSEAMEYVMGGSGSIFDPSTVQMFTKKIHPYPVGTCVRLSNNLVGIVIKNHNQCGMRPRIKIISGELDGEIYDLYSDRNLLNVTILGIAQI